MAFGRWKFEGLSDGSGNRKTAADARGWARRAGACLPEPTPSVGSVEPDHEEEFGYQLNGPSPSTRSRLRHPEMGAQPASDFGGLLPSVG